MQPHRLESAEPCGKAKDFLESDAPLMKSSPCCLFETALGWCGIAWRDGGRFGAGAVVTHLKLPEASREATEARIARGIGAHKSSADPVQRDQPHASPPDKVPPEITNVIQRVRRHLTGEFQDFQDVALDLEGASPFAREVYDATRKIASGETTTYGELARSIHRPNALRAIGRALGRNPVCVIIPCHRVLAAGGKSGGFSAHGGRLAKLRLLEIEGAAFANANRLLPGL